MQLFFNLNLSLTTKLIVVSVVVESVLLSFLIWNDTKLTQTKLLEEKQEEINELATFISATVAPALSRNDMQELFDAVKQIGQSPKINYAAIKTLTDQTIAQIGVSKQTKPTNQDLLDYVKINEHTDLYQINVPLETNDTVLGQLQLEFRIDDVGKLLADVQRRGTINAVILILVTAILLYVLLSALTKNLKNLTSAMTEYINHQNISTPIPHSNDEVGKLGTTFENLISAIREGEESLKESQDFLQAILDHSPAVIYAKDKDGKYLLANQQLAGILPNTVGNILGSTDFDLFPPEVASKLQANDKKVLANKSIQLLEEVVPVQGQPRTYISTKFCLFDKNNEVYAVCGISTDISERIRNEQKTRESEENLRSLANNAIDGILVNKKGKHVFANQRMADILNTTVDEIIGSNQDYVLHPSEKNNVVQRFKRRLTGQNEPIQYETSFVDKKTGDPVPVELTAFISQWDGEPSGVVFVRDIKERKKIEAELNCYRKRLEHMVSERTAELESAVRELESFSYSVSHDLRSPLRSIDGFSQILLEDYQNKLDEQGTDYLIRVRKAAQRMAQLIDDILLLSRVSRHKLSLMPADLTHISEESAASLQELYPERKVELEIEPNMETTADRSLLRIVMDNLLGNAWKYTSKNDHAVIECGSKRENGRTVFYVKDNGVGFNMSYVQKLFGAFQRLHGIDEFPGTGIGLATVKRIIDRHGGKVWAEGKPGEGATFYFTLR